MWLGLIMIASALGIGGYVLEHRPQSSKATKIALGGGYSVVLAKQDDGRFSWGLVYDFEPGQIVAAGNTATPEEASIQARTAMATDMAKRGLSAVAMGT